MTKKVVIESNFNTYGFNPQRLTRPWLEKRIEIFRSFTLKSLLAQTNPDFLAIFKIVPETERIVSEILAKYPPLPRNVWFGTISDSADRIKAFAEKSEYLYLARMDSDDLFHRTYVQQLYDFRPKSGTKALINQNGYALDVLKGEMVPMFRKSPPYYVFLYKTKEYLSGYRVKIPGRGTHGSVIELPHELLTPRNFVEVNHGHNTQMRQIPEKGRLNSAEQKKVLKEFMQ